MSTISESLIVRCPIGVLAGMLSDEPGRWLAPFLRIACHDGDAEGVRMRERLGLHESPTHASRKTVVVTLGTAVCMPDNLTLELPVRWVAVGYRSVLPVFEGHLELSPVSEGETLVRLHGVGKGVGAGGSAFGPRMVARRATEAAVRSLLTNVGVALAETHHDLPEPAPAFG